MTTTADPVDQTPTFQITKEHHEALEDTKIGILLDKNSIFLATILFNTECSFSTDIPTACTDGLKMIFNPEFFMSYNKKQRQFIMAHETYHIAFEHMLRYGDKCPKKFNAAADYAINLLLEDEGYEMISGILLDNQYRDMSAEEIYSLLPKDEENQNNSMGNDFQAPDDNGVLDPTAKDKIQDVIMKAATAADLGNQAGSVPGSIRDAIKEKLYPQLPWEVLLDKYMNDKSKEDYSYVKPNRRFPNTIMPTLYSEGIGTIDIYVDTSCSVSDLEFAAQKAEIYKIKEDFNPKEMNIILFNTKILDVIKVDSSEDLEIDFRASGGTKIKEVAERINEGTSEINLIFSDGEYQEIPFNKEVLHVVINNPTYETDLNQPVIHYSTPVGKQ